MTSPVSLETQAKIASWRQRSAEGTLSLEEMKEIVVLLREGRGAAVAASSAAKRSKAVAAIPVATDLLGELEGM